MIWHATLLSQLPAIQSLTLCMLQTTGWCWGVCDLRLPGTGQTDQRRVDARGATLWIFHEAETAYVGIAGRYQYFS